MVRLQAKRAGDRLIFICNDHKIEFEDGLPLTTAQTGTFGLHQSYGVQILNVQGRAKTVKEVPGPLEKADDLYAEEKFADALGLYQAQVQTAGSDSRLRQEAGYKQALCLLSMKNDAAALKILDGIAMDAGSGGDHWRVLALCQLWGAYLKAGKEKEAAVVFSLMPRHNVNEMLIHLPDAVRDEVLTHYRWRQTGLTAFLGRTPTVASRETALEIEKFFRTSRMDQLRSQHVLFQTCVAARQTKRAFEIAAILNREVPRPEPAANWWFDFWEEYCRFLRGEKQAARRWPSWINDCGARRVITTPTACRSWSIEPRCWCRWAVLPRRKAT